MLTFADLPRGSSFFFCRQMRRRFRSKNFGRKDSFGLAVVWWGTIGSCAHDFLFEHDTKNILLVKDACGRCNVTPHHQSTGVGSFQDDVFVLFLNWRQRSIRPLMRNVSLSWASLSSSLSRIARCVIIPRRGPRIHHVNDTFESEVYAETSVVNYVTRQKKKVFIGWRKPRKFSQGMT